MSGTAGPASLVQLLKTDPTKQTQSQSAKVRTGTCDSTASRQYCT